MVRVEPATVAWLEALVEGDEVFEERFGIPVEPDWAGFPEAVPLVLAELRDGRAAEWGTHLFFADDDGRADRVRGLEGPARRRRRRARLRRGARPARAAAWPPRSCGSSSSGPGRPALALVLAHTLPEESPSTGVLRRSGFTMTGEVVDGDDVVWRWELPI